MTREQVIAALLKLKKKLGRVPTHVELIEKAGVSRKMVRRHFAKYSALLAELKLKGKGTGYPAELEEVFLDWARVARAMGKLPSLHEYELKGKFSVGPILVRFGSWMAAPSGLKQFAEKHGLAAKWKDVLRMVMAREKQDRAVQRARGAMSSEPGPEDKRRGRELKAAVQRWPKSLKPLKELYGRMMRPCAMLCAPVNEQGVVLLFGAMAEKLGFAVLKVGTAYPDCLAFRVVDGELMELLKIEFEWESRNFLVHKHKKTDCDMIVCWKHNWAECPLEVVELSRWF